MSITFNGSPFVTNLQKFQFLDKYSKFRYDLGRRESWSETVTRTIDHLRYLVNRYTNKQLSEQIWQEIHDGISNLKVSPAMRLFSVAGDAAKRSGISQYNCAYMPICSFDCFNEAVTILINGSGLGYAVTNNYISQFPKIKQQKNHVLSFVFDDTSESWADGIRFGIENWWNGYDVVFDYSKIRPAGSPLITKGGRASGPESLKQSLDKIRKVILDRQNMSARSLDIHDIICLIAMCIVSGGFRRSALICLFDYDDVLIKTCKDGNNIIGNEHRYCSNNSVVWKERLTQNEVYKFVEDMLDGNNGEPGIFSQYAVKNTLPQRRNDFENWGCNPCAEIVLKGHEGGGQFCNLTSVIARQNDTRKTLMDKIRLATIIGTIQSLETNFPGLRIGWMDNCIEERLLGVDIQGILDCPVLMNPFLLEDMRLHAINVNQELSGYFGIAHSPAITTVKPSGSSSLLNNSSPGIHSRWSKYYIRRAQIQKESPIAQLFMDYAPDFIEPLIYMPDTTFVISFPERSPDTAITREQLSCLDQLENWKLFKTKYTEHSPSCTVTYKHNEIDDLKTWIFDNQDIISGLSFLPFNNTVYEQLPYETISKEEYDQLSNRMPYIDWSKLPEYEKEDHTTKAVACSSDKCELVYA